MDIRELIPNDCELIAAAFAQQGWNKPVTQYTRYLEEQQAGLRTVLVARVDGCFVGYLTIMWQSGYQPFAEQHIPEIVDLNVLIAYQRRGVGSALMDAAEHRIAARSRIAGIGVGLTPDYGPAQILYVKRGYVPDGRGLVQNNQILMFGSLARMDDGLVLHLLKQLNM